jgi:hypothetical protein
VLMTGNRPRALIVANRGGGGDVGCGTGLSARAPDASRYLPLVRVMRSPGRRVSSPSGRHRTYTGHRWQAYGALVVVDLEAGRWVGVR